MIKWEKLSDKKPEGSGPFLYFPVITDVGHTISVSNGDYLRGPYVNIDLTYWAEIDKPPTYSQIQNFIQENLK